MTDVTDEWIKNDICRVLCRYKLHYVAIRKDKARNML